MKHFISLTLAALIIAFVVFALMHWVLGNSFADAGQTAVTIGITGLIVEILRPAIIRWSKHLNITANRKPAKR